MDTEKKTFVLVHGAWHGGWVWQGVMTLLRSLGPRGTAPTLTGLGERKHLATCNVDQRSRTVLAFAPRR
jgi:hypothetical protein